MDTGSLLYYGGLTLWSALVAYGLLAAFPKKRVVPDVVISEPAPLPERPVVAAPAPAPAVSSGKPTPEQLNTEGFKAFQRGQDLAVEDIVKGLSRD